MKYAKVEETEIGESVFIPINGEEWADEQIFQEYEVVKALKCKTPVGEQIVGIGKEPMPLLLEFTDETAIKE